MQQTLNVLSLQSDNAAATCRQIARYLGEQLNVPTQFVNDPSWQEREQLLDDGQAHVAWVCGAYYARKVDREAIPLELVSAPVMKAPRYRQKPIYFSDVIVRRDSPYRTFADLRGASWAYNEPHSHSGYIVTRHHLATLGEYTGYFGEAAAAGSHLRAIEWVRQGRVAAGAIDSTVLDIEWQARPELRQELRVITALGPSPIPPWVVLQTVPAALRDGIRAVFRRMHKTTAGQAILAQGQMIRMVPVADKDYDPIREMERVAESVIWKLS